MAKNIIKEIRLALTLNQSELARAINMQPSDISNYEAGRRRPGMATIRKLIAFAKQHKIKLTAEDFFNDHN